MPKAPLHRIPKSDGHSKSNNKLTLSKPAKIFEHKSEKKLNTMEEAQLNLLCAVVF